MNLLIGKDDYQLKTPVACSAGRLEHNNENVDQSKRSGPPSPFKKCISGISLPSNLRNLISDKDSQIAAARNSSGKRKYVTRSRSESVVPVRAMTDVYVDPTSILRHSSVPCSNSYGEQLFGLWLWVCCKFLVRLYLLI